VWKGCSQASSHATNEQNHPAVSDRKELPEALTVVLNHLQETINDRAGMEVRDYVLKSSDLARPNHLLRAVAAPAHAATCQGLMSLTDHDDASGFGGLLLTSSRSPIQRVRWRSRVLSRGRNADAIEDSDIKIEVWLPESAVQLIEASFTQTSSSDCIRAAPLVRTQCCGRIENHL
jgi:hypothetical protein